MANIFETPDLISREALRVLENVLVTGKTLRRVEESQFAKEGNKIGDVFNVRKPMRFESSLGATIDVQDITEETVPVTIQHQRHVPFKVSSWEKTLDIERFSERVLMPAVCQLAADIDYHVLQMMYEQTFNHVGSAGTLMSKFDHANAARARLNLNLAPMRDRFMLAHTDDMTSVSNSLHTNFNKQAEIDKIFMEGYIGNAAGFPWLESAIVPVHKNGSRDDSTPIVNTDTGITSGTATITMTGQGGTDTINKGDVFTVAGVYAVNEQTRVRQKHLQQFVVTQSRTGPGDIKVSPTPITSGPRQNVDIEGAGASKVLSWVGDENISWNQNMAFHKDSFALAVPPMDMPFDESWATRMSKNGMSIRIVSSYDINNDINVCRLDAIYGLAPLYPQHCVRVSG